MHIHTDTQGTHTPTKAHTHELTHALTHKQVEQERLKCESMKEQAVLTLIVTTFTMNTSSHVTIITFRPSRHVSKPRHLKPRRYTRPHTLARNRIHSGTDTPTLTHTPRGHMCTHTHADRWR